MALNNENQKRKIKIYVFSGTDNTFTAANMVAAALEARGARSFVQRISLPFPVADTADYDLIGLGYPVHAFNAPQIVCRFVKSFPVDKGKKVFLFKTSGEPFSLNDSSSVFIARTLRKKGYQVIQDMHMLMPYNIMFRYRDSLAKQMYLHTERMAALLAKYVLKGPDRPPKYKLRHTIITILLRIQWLAPVVNIRLMRVNPDKCTLCMKCVRECPTKSISVHEADGATATLSSTSSATVKTATEKPKRRIRFSGKCAMCMRCAFNCPADAVSFGFLNPWKVNGPYNFSKLIADENVPARFVDENTTGYFKLFRKYYTETELELRRNGIL